MFVQPASSYGALSACAPRHRESVLLLSPARGAGDRHRYGPNDVYRVSVILHAKEVWFSLEVIRGMLTAQDPTVRIAILRRRQADLVRRVAAGEGLAEADRVRPGM